MEETMEITIFFLVKLDDIAKIPQCVCVCVSYFIFIFDWLNRQECRALFGGNREKMVKGIQPILLSSWIYQWKWWNDLVI